jgi:transcriptional regulator with XRE-family HTH domain
VDARTNETLGRRLARLREAGGLTQEALAQKANVPVTSLRNWELDRRRPRADAMLVLARSLGLTVEALLDGVQVGPARAETPDSHGLASLKRAWKRADAEEKRAFLEFVRQEGDGGGTAASPKVAKPASRRRKEKE